MLVLGILARGDELGEPGGPLEDQHEGHGTGKRPRRDDTGRVAAPLVENEPHELLGGEIRMPAVCPQARRDKAPVKVGLRVWVGDPAIRAVTGLGRLIVPLLTVADVLGDDEADYDHAVDPVGRVHFGFEVGREQDDVAWPGRESEEKDVLEERNEGDVEDEEGPGGNLAAND